MLRIGVTSTRAPQDALAHADDRPYLEALRAFGVEPVVLANDLGTLAEAVAALDAVLLTGGPDVDPARYGEAAHPSVVLALPERDEFELALVHEARRRLLPALCICRGLQVANVAFGGSLIQDLPSHFGDEYVIHHRQTKEDGMDRTDYGIDHYVMVEPESRLAAVVGSAEFATNSMHHQAVRGVGRGLRAVAWTHDGVIEALDAEFEHPFFCCVQWHPEELLDDEVTKRLFDGFIAAARDGAALARS